VEQLELLQLLQPPPGANPPLEERPVRKADITRSASPPHCGQPTPSCWPILQSFSKRWPQRHRNSYMGI